MRLCQWQGNLRKVESDGQRASGRLGILGYGRGWSKAGLVRGNVRGGQLYDWTGQDSVATDIMGGTGLADDRPIRRR